MIHNLTLKAIKFSFLGNFRNELYFADRCLHEWNNNSSTETYMKMLIHSLQSHEEAAIVYQELVSNNKQLLETKINEDDVDIFVELIRKRGPVAEFLQFLTAICACKGEPLVHNQELMLKEIYSASLQTNNAEKNRYCLLVETIVDPRDGEDAFDRPFTASMEVPDPEGVMGGKIVENGYRNLLVGWYGSEQWKETVSESAFYLSPQQLGLKTVTIEPSLLPEDLQKYHKKVGLKETGKGFQWVRIRDIMWTLQPDVMKRKANAGAGDNTVGWTDFKLQMDSSPVMKRRFEQTRELAEYYVAQIELFATMCFDRSYNCMRLLQSQFSYEVLVTAMADTALPDPLRSAFTNLLYVLYVDKYPQETLRIPNLVRPESEVDTVSLSDGDALPRFQYTHEEGSSTESDKVDASPTKFYILQVCG